MKAQYRYRCRLFPPFTRYSTAVRSNSSNFSIMKFLCLLVCPVDLGKNRQEYMIAQKIGHTIFNITYIKRKTELLYDQVFVRLSTCLSVKTLFLRNAQQYPIEIYFKYLSLLVRDPHSYENIKFEVNVIRKYHNLFMYHMLCAFFYFKRE